MACCAVGAAITAAVVWILRFVRRRMLLQASEVDAAAWRLRVQPAGGASGGRDGEIGR